MASPTKSEDGLWSEIIVLLVVIEIEVKDDDIPSMFPYSETVKTLEVVLEGWDVTTLVPPLVLLVELSLVCEIKFWVGLLCDDNN